MRRWRPPRLLPPRLRTLLLVSNMAVLTLPLTGLSALRLYESALIRQTEAELVSQAVLWAAAFRAELRRVDPAAAPLAAAPPEAGLDEDAAWLLRLPGLDLADDPVLPPPPPPHPAPLRAEAGAEAVGRALNPMVRDAQTLTLSALRLLDARGVVVASTGLDMGLSLAGWPEVDAVLARAPLATTMRRREPVQARLGGLSRNPGLRVFVAMPVRGAAGVVGAVVLSRTPRDAVQAIWGKRWALSGLAALLLAIGVLLAAGLSRLVTRPLADVVAQARRAALGEEVAPMRHPGRREVADLSAALARMAATMEQRARYIIAFAASVSHEFKTPLAGLRGAAELLEDHADTLPPRERARLLSVVSGSVERLDALVARLLTLARADMMRPDFSTTTPVAAVLDDLVGRYRAGGLAVSVIAACETVALPSDALAALLASLLDNAAAHAGPGATVRVRASAASGRTHIVVEDDGQGVSAANRARIFEPFFTTARAEGGTGLGLAIARAIALAAGGTVDLIDSAAGATFTVELPKGPQAGERAL